MRKGKKQPMASKYGVSQIENEISGLPAGILLTGYCILACDLPIMAFGWMYSISEHFK